MQQVVKVGVVDAVCITMYVDSKAGCRTAAKISSRLGLSFETSSI